MWRSDLVNNSQPEARYDASISASRDSQQRAALFGKLTERMHFACTTGSSIYLPEEEDPDHHQSLTDTNYSHSFIWVWILGSSRSFRRDIWVRDRQSRQQRQIYEAEVLVKTGYP